MAPNSELTVPIVLGFVGHREMPEGDESKLRDALMAVFQKFRAGFPNSPLVLLTSAAKGADCVAIETARELKVTVRIILPMPREDFLLSTSFDRGPHDSGLDLRAQERAGRLLDASGDAITELAFPTKRRSDGTEEPQPDWPRVRHAPRDTPEAQIRHESYANASGYITRHCHALIAFWDGEPGSNIGTGKSVEFKLKAIPPADYPHREPLRYGGEAGPVIVIRGRKKATDPADPVGIPWLALPRAEEWVRWADVCLSTTGPQRLLNRVLVSWGRQDPSTADELACHDNPPNDPVHDPVGVQKRAEKRERLMRQRELDQFLETLHSVETFNADAAKNAPPAEAIKTWKALLEKVPLDPADDAELKRIADLRDLAAHLADTKEKELRPMQILLYALLFLAVVFFHFYGHLPNHSVSPPEFHPVWLALFLAAVLVALLTVFWVWFGRLDQRRLDYRSLAEAFRVRFFWAVAGSGLSVADSYLGQLRGSMTWARRALQGIAPVPETWRKRFRDRGAETQTQLLAAVGKLWIRGQIDYFHRQHQKEHFRATGLRRSAIVLTTIGWMGGGVLLFMFVFSLWSGGLFEAPTPDHPAHGVAASAPSHPESGIHAAPDRVVVHDSPAIEHPTGDARHPNHLFLVGSALVIVLGGFLNAWCEKRSHEELAHQYDRMLLVFELGARELQAALDAGKPEQALKVIEALGQEAIAEHAQWLILRRARPFELHLG